MTSEEDFGSVTRMSRELGDYVRIESKPKPRGTRGSATPVVPQHRASVPNSSEQTMFRSSPDVSYSHASIHHISPKSKLMTERLKQRQHSHLHGNEYHTVPAPPKATELNVSKYFSVPNVPKHPQLQSLNTRPKPFEDLLELSRQKHFSDVLHSRIMGLNYADYHTVPAPPRNIYNSNQKSDYLHYQSIPRQRREVSACLAIID